MFRQTVSSYPDTPALGHKEGEEWKKINYSVYTIKVTIMNNSNRQYRIAGNFRGSKLSRRRPKIIFMEIIFANFIIQPFCTVFFIILRISKIAKRAKVIGLESFWLYGNILIFKCNKNNTVYLKFSLLMEKQQYNTSQFTTNFTLTFSQIITCEVSNVLSPVASV